MTSQQRDAIRRAVDEINPLKSRLMELQRSLESAGARGPAKQLDAIIGRLEGWQAKQAA